MTRQQSLGERAEQQAKAFLQHKGLTIESHNYRCRTGEIDLIMRDGETLVFVEVRFRRNTDYGGALTSVDTRKQQKLTRAANHYLMTSGWQGPCRFDVVGIDAGSETQWIRNAF